MNKQMMIGILKKSRDEAKRLTSEEATRRLALLMLEDKENFTFAGLDVRMVNNCQAYDADVKRIDKNFAFAVKLIRKAKQDE